MEKENKIHQWFKAKGNYFFLYDKPENKNWRKTNYDIVKICGAQWDGEKCTLNYFTDGDGWLDEYKASIRIKKAVQRITNTSRVIVSADNQKFSKLYGKMCAVQVFWLSKELPSPDTMFAIAERIEKLKETVPLKFEDCDIYHQRYFQENDQECDPSEDSEVEEIAETPTDPIYFDSNGRLRTEWYKCPQS